MIIGPVVDPGGGGFRGCTPLLSISIDSIDAWFLIVVKLHEAAHIFKQWCNMFLYLFHTISNNPYSITNK